MITPNKVLWFYVVLLLVGGLVGYFKARSPVSLVTSAAFAAGLMLCALGVVFQPYVADLLLGALVVMFAMRLAKTKKFMPAGVMLVATVVTLAVRHLRG